MYGIVFRRWLRAMGIRDWQIAPRSPWRNGLVERLIGSVRCECLDHLVVRGQTHPRRVLTEYAEY
jgi:transposase InsO family protein